MSLFSPSLFLEKTTQRLGCTFRKGLSSLGQWTLGPWSRKRVGDITSLLPYQFTGFFFFLETFTKEQEVELTKN